MDEFAAISDVARADDPVLVRSFLSFFRHRLEELLINPPPSLEHWRVPLEHFDDFSLDDILWGLRRRGPHRQWEHLMAMKNVGNLGAHMNLYVRWRNRTLLQFKSDEATRMKRSFNPAHLPSLAAALRGCRTLGIEVPADARAFWARVNPAAVLEAAVDLPAGAPDAYPPEDDGADGGTGPGGAAAVAANAEALDRLARAQDKLARAESRLRAIAELESRQAAGGPLLDEVEVAADRAEAVEKAAASSRAVASSLRGLGRDEEARPHAARAAELSTGLSAHA